MSYIQCFIIPVVTKRLGEYRPLAAEAAIIWKELGALSVVEAEGDNTPVGEVTSFPRALLLKDDETVVFSYVRFRDRADCDRIMEQMMQDDRFLRIRLQAPVDENRVILGGFDEFVSV
ncbi:MAG TPA: DUF1428 domain-containing protein [Paracoccaceae bacterium]